jgi:tetratricopeptide (TPR) repeat protein
MLPAARNLVVYFETQGDAERVAELYQTILSFDPFDTTALIRQANAFRNLGNLDGATLNYERAIAVYPYYRFWYAEMAELLEQKHQTEAAALWRERAETLGGDEAEMAFEDGITHLREGNFELASAIFEAVLEELPANLEARLHLARALARTGRDDEALEQYATALDLAEQTPALVLVQRARFYLARKRVDEARRDLSEALQHTPNYGRAKAMLRGLEAAGRGSEPLAGVSVEMPPNAPPEFATVDTSQPFGAQIAHTLEQALAMPNRAGGPGRIALLIEPHPSLTPLVNELISIVTQPHFGLYGVEPPRLFAALGQVADVSDISGMSWSGWVDPASLGMLAPSRWQGDTGGLAIDRMLERATEVAADTGFNLVLIVSTGRVRADQTGTVGAMRRLPAYQVASVQRAEGSGDLGLRLQGVAPNWVTIHGL